MVSFAVTERHIYLGNMIHGKALIWIGQVYLYNALFQNKYILKAKNNFTEEIVSHFSFEIKGIVIRFICHLLSEEFQKIADKMFQKLSEMRL